MQVLRFYSCTWWKCQYGALEAAFEFAKVQANDCFLIKNENKEFFLFIFLQILSKIALFDDSEASADSFISKERKETNELWQQFFLMRQKTCSKCNLEMIKSGSSSAEDFVDVISLEAIRKSSAGGTNRDFISTLNLKAIKEE